MSTSQALFESVYKKVSRSNIATLDKVNNHNITSGSYFKDKNLI